jgi:hypothetical protein
LLSASEVAGIYMEQGQFFETEADPARVRRLKQGNARRGNGQTLGEFAFEPDGLVHTEAFRVFKSKTSLKSLEAAAPKRSQADCAELTRETPSFRSPISIC